MTRRASRTLDLAATIRLSAGDDLTPQSRRVGSRKGNADDGCRSQAAAAAIEKQEEVASMAADSPPAQMGNLDRGNDLPPFAVVALLDRSDR